MRLWSEPARAVEPLRKAVDLESGGPQRARDAGDALLAERSVRRCRHAVRRGRAAHARERARLAGRSARATTRWRRNCLISSHAPRRTPRDCRATGEIERDRGQWARAFERYRRALAIAACFRGSAHRRGGDLREDRALRIGPLSESAASPTRPLTCGTPIARVRFLERSAARGGASRGEYAGRALLAR